MSEQNTSELDEQIPFTESPQSLGAKLRQAREAHGLSCADIGKVTKLSEKQIFALEEQNFDKLPSPVFVKGFYKQYAAYVGLNIDSELAQLQFNQRTQMSLGHIGENTLGVLPSVRKRFPIVKGFFVLILLLLLGVITWFSYHYWNQRPVVIVTTGSNETGIIDKEDKDEVEPASDLMLDRSEVLVPKEQDEQREKGTNPVESTQPKSTLESDQSRHNKEAETQISGNDVQHESNIANSAKATQNTLTDSVKEISPSVADNQVLSFESSDKNWVEVKDHTGDIIFSGTILSGSKQTLKGEPPFSLVIGNAQAMQLEYMGKPVDLTAHIRGAVARLQIP